MKNTSYAPTTLSTGQQDKLVAVMKTEASLGVLEYRKGGRWKWSKMQKNSGQLDEEMSQKNLNNCWTDAKRGGTGPLAAYAKECKAKEAAAE